jgi:S1-C subfamily serine protease
MRSLTPGERIDVAGTAHDVRLSAAEAGFLARSIGVVLVPLGADGRTLPTFAPLLGGDTRKGLVISAGEGFAVDLPALPEAVDRVAVVLYVVGGRATGTSLADLGRLALNFDVGLRFEIDLSTRMESALIACEFYRRARAGAPAWRLAANGQGFIGGITAINQALGIELVVPDSELASPPPAARRSAAPPPGSSGGGSGFAVTQRLVITNHHVIEHARTIAAAGELGTGPATLVATDMRNDLALLMLDHEAAQVARFRADHDIDLGEDVIVGGFPLQGLLGQGPQISGGNISALTGMHNDSSVLTFNAPIGSGNSGGPILDAGGMVVGVVCSVLRGDIDRETIVQNVNFGVKASLVRSFIHAAGHTPLLAREGPRSRAEVAREARRYLYRIDVGY